MSTLALTGRQTFAVRTQSTGASPLSAWLKGEIDSAFRTLRESKKQEFGELERVVENCSVPNWDNYGAAPVSEAAFREARRFLGLLPLGIPPPEITPEPDGEIAIEWHIAKQWILSISFGGRGVITFAGLFGADTKDHGTEPFHDAIPETAYRLIQKIAGYSA